ncbi:hypothetical protein C8D88_12310 [Lentzea atacamensis]|uniref:Uncharacterized protein n=1 Tax=Lentzea atacamensis TaxID=531938 RepID=A0A316HJF4_9PSEU|nr:hypothetical protein [Lentzea atacamensis]PWK80646.1 hypothetical protein C8D88_12310 [Lentzea atacamensis]
MNRGEAITTWLKPLRPVLDPGNQIAIGRGSRRSPTRWTEPW